MKFLKLFSILVFSAVTLNLSATITAHTYFKIASTGEGKADAIDLYQSPDEFFLGDDIKNTSNKFCVNLYAVVDGKDYCSVKQADLDDVVIKFQANAYETEYKITLSGDIEIQKEGVTVVDGQTFTCEKNEVVEFTIAQAPAAYTRNVTANQWGTICYPKSITEVQGGTLYSLTYTDGAKVYAEEVVLPTTAGQAYIFQANADATQLVMPYTGDEASVQTTHGLVGTFDDTTVPAGAYGILNNVVVEIAAGNALLANRAYIKMEDLISDNAPKRGRAIFMIQNATTGLEGATVNGLQNGTYMVNGQLVIVKDGKTFNVLGL